MVVVAGADLRLVYRHLVLPKLSCAHQPAHSPQSKRANHLHHVLPSPIGIRCFVLVVGYSFARPRSLIVVPVTTPAHLVSSCYLLACPMPIICRCSPPARPPAGGPTSWMKTPWLTVLETVRFGIESASTSQQYSRTVTGGYCLPQSPPCAGDELSIHNQK